jgi:hypothetical protein
MARSTRVPGEKPLLWVGSAKDDLLDFPEAAKDEIGVACRPLSPCHPERSGSVRSKAPAQSKSLPRAKPRGPLLPLLPQERVREFSPRIGVIGQHP